MTSMKLNTTIKNKPILASLFSDSCASEGVRAMFYLLKSESVMPVHAVLSRRVHSMFSEGRLLNILFVIVELNKLIQQCLIRRHVMTFVVRFTMHHQ